MSPSRVAVVEMLWEFEPASGSVMANAIFNSAVAKRGSHSRFCSSEPNLAMMVAQMAGETTSKRRGQPLAPSCSRTMANSLIPMPPGPVHPQEARCCQLVPQVVGPPSAAGLLGEVAVAVLGGDGIDRLAE